MKTSLRKLFSLKSLHPAFPLSASPNKPWNSFCWEKHCKSALLCRSNRKRKNVSDLQRQEGESSHFRATQPLCSNIFLFTCQTSHNCASTYSKRTAILFMGFSVHKSMNLDQNLPSSILAQASSEVKLIWKYSNSTSSLSEILTSYSFKHLVIRRTGISPTGSLQMLHADSSSIFSYFCSIYSLNSWRCLLAVFQLEKKKKSHLGVKKKTTTKILDWSVGVQ